MLEDVISKVSIDYSNQEIQDIQTAVHTMLEKIVTRVNERGWFKISCIQPVGSMVEQTAVWKYGGWTRDRYTEFDFLAVLDNSPEIERRDHGCGQCVEVSEMPVGGYTEFEFLNALDYSREIICVDRNCIQCFDISEPPVPIEARSKLHEYENLRLELYPNRYWSDQLFWK